VRELEMDAALCGRYATFVSRTSSVGSGAGPQT
jgi:hypothetical protein